MNRPIPIRDWSRFDPQDYLREYYCDLGPENRALTRFFAEAYRDVAPDAVLLDFGGGPTIYPLIAAAPRVREIHFSDYLEANLREVRAWIAGESSAFDWQPFVRLSLELEAGNACSDADVERREAELRRSITRVMRCDASRRPAIEVPGIYEIVVTNFCAESAARNHRQWREFVHNIAALLQPGGRLLLSALKGASAYSVGARTFSAVSIDESDLVDVLVESGFPRKGIALETVAADRPSRTYAGMILSACRKRDD
jgi:hypothetical protein